MNIWEFIKTIETEEDEEQKKDKQTSGGGGSTGAIEPKDPLELLNTTIEKNYKDFLKLQKNLTEFDTTLSEVPPAIKPSVVANYNKEVKRFNSLLSELQTNIAERDKIHSVLKKQDFVRKKQCGIYQPQQESQPQESGLKDIWDAFRLGASGMFHKSKQYFSSVLPNTIFRDLKVEDTVSQYAGMTESQVDKLNIENKKKREAYKEGYIKGESNYNLWLQKHPELQPREEWEKGVIETIKQDPKVLLDPAYWGYVAAESAAFTLGVMGTVLATTAVTGNPLIGLASGVLIATPMQTQELYEDLIANGATEEEATKLSVPIGGIIASVEVMGDLPILASVSAPFKKLLFGNIRKGAVKATAGFLKKGIKRAALIEASETLEEVVQGGIQDATVKTVNENRDMLANIPETVVHTLIATAPFALVGLGTEAQITKQLKEKVTNIEYLNAVRVQLEEQGFVPRMEAEALAYEAKEEPPKVEPKEPIKIEVIKKDLERRAEKIEQPYLDELLKVNNQLLEMHTIINEGRSFISGLKMQPRDIVFTKKELPKVEKKKLDIESRLKEVEKENKIYNKEQISKAKKELKAKPKPPTTPEELEAKREVLREHGVKEELLTDEFVKIAKITELPKADVTSEIVSEKLIEDLEKKWGKEKKLTKKEVLEKVEKPKAEVKEPEIPVIESYTPYEKMNMLKTGARVDRLKTLYNLKGKGIEKVNINGKIESLETVIKRTQEQSNLPELEKAGKVVEPKEEPKAKPKEPTIPTTEKKAEVEKGFAEKQEEPPKVPPISPKEVALGEEPEFPKDVKIKDVYTIGERTPAKKVKGKVREITGQTKKDKILIAELDILDLVLKGQEKVAKKAFSEGKKKGIFDQKEHFKDIVARAKERKAQKDYVDKLIKDINKLPTEKVHIDYKDKIQAIKDMFDLKKRKEKTLHAREETAKFIEREMEVGNTKLQIPQDVIDLIKKKPLNDMTIIELEEVHDNILHLAHIGKTKGKLLKIQKGRRTEELVKDLTNTLYQGKEVPTDRNLKQEIKKAQGLVKKAKDIWSHFWVNTTLDEALFERMDGGERGLFCKTFYDVINQCKNDELSSNFGKIEDSQNFIADNKIDIVKFTEERTGDLMLTHAQRTGVYLCSLDEDAKRHIQEAGVYAEKGIKEPYKFTDKDIDNVVNSLTKEEKAMAKYYQKYQSIQGEQLDEFDVRVRGVHLKKVKNRYAIQVLNEELENSEAIELERNPTTRRAYLEQGFRKERTHRAENVINIDCVSNMLRDMAKVEHYKAYEEAVMDINNLLTNEDLKRAIINHPKYGRIAYDNIVQWFRDSVKAKQNKILSTSDKALMFLRTSAFLSMLGINVISGSKQLVSLCNAVAETNLATILSGIEQIALHYNETKQFVFKRDPQMKGRKGQIDKIMREWMESADAKQLLTGKSKDIRLKTLFLIRTLDEFAVLSVWKGTYDQQINQNKSEKEAIKRAGEVMRKTQPAAQIKDLPQWFRDGTVANLFSLFQNQINKNQNYIRHDMFGKLKAGKIDSQTFAHRILWGWMLPAVLIGTITRGRPPEDWKELARDIGTYYIGGWFFVGSMVVNMMMGYGGWMPAPLSFGEEFVKAYTYKTWKSKFKHIISGICKVIGLPFNQPYRTIEGVEDWLEGETEDARRLIWSKYALEQGKKKEKKVKVTEPKGFGGLVTISEPKGFGD